MTARPYQQAWETYRQAGWPTPIAMPPRDKQPPPKGFTGHGGIEPSGADAHAWAEDPHDLNIALRLPPDVVGIDVDAYDGRRGADTIAELEADLGPLPATWVTSARLDTSPESGIRYYRIPPGTRLISALPNVEMIQHHHRYAMAPPSVHPSGQPYRSVDQRTGEADTIADPHDLPELPQRWLDHLREDRERPERNAAAHFTNLLGEMPGGPPCNHVQAALGRAEQATSSRHDAYLSAVLAVLADGRRGCPGARHAITLLGQSWMGKMAAERGHDTAQREFLRMLEGAAPIIGDIPQGTCCPDTIWWEDTKTLEDQVFGHSDLLGHIRQAARARLVSPWALLGCILARTIAETHHAVVIPPIIGSPASLNSYIGLVGPSGVGKTAVNALATEVLRPTRAPRATTQGAGTGEGLINSLLATITDETGKKVRVVKDPAALCVLVDEIGLLDAHQNRQGSTIAPVLRAAWSGALLDTINADPDRIRRVPAHTYRIAVIAGIQPEAAHTLLDDAATGTPQRWIWLPATDPDMPDTPPEWPGHIPWTPPRLPKTGPDGRIHITLPEAAVAETMTIHRARLRGDQDNDRDLDGHANLTRLKLAAALAILHGTFDVDTPTWELAGKIIGKSNATREECVNAVGKARKRLSEARGIAAAQQRMAERKAFNETAEKAAKALWRTVDAHTEDGAERSKHPAGVGCTRRCGTNALRGYRGRITVEEALDAAVANGWIIDHDGRWTPGEEVPA